MLDINVSYIITIVLFQSIVLIIIFQSLSFGVQLEAQRDIILGVIPYLSYMVFIVMVVVVYSINKLLKVALEKKDFDIQETNRS